MLKAFEIARLYLIFIGEQRFELQPGNMMSDAGATLVFETVVRSCDLGSCFFSFAHLSVIIPSTLLTNWPWNSRLRL